MAERCRRWITAELSEADVYQGFKHLITFVDESHLIRRLQRCIECGQLYFYEFYEEIDWARGNDPQYRTLVPVASVGDAVVLAHVSSIDLLSYQPQLRSDWPSDAKQPTVYWLCAKKINLLNDREISNKR